jgi:hypothetical protein
LERVSAVQDALASEGASPEDISAASPAVAAAVHRADPTASLRDEAKAFVQTKATHLLHRACVGAPYPEVAWETLCGWNYGLGNRARFLKRDDLSTGWKLLCSGCFDHLKAERKAAANCIFSAQST